MMDRLISKNRRARYDYEILESFEAGIVLTGTEIKSIRDGRVNIAQSYAKPSNGEIWLTNAHIAAYEAGNINNHDPVRERKLLLHKNQIRRLIQQVSTSGLTLVPLRLYIRNHVAKIQLGLGKGRKRYDKRKAMIDSERSKEAREAQRR